MTKLTEPGYLYVNIRAPDTKPYYPCLEVWANITLPSGETIFPSIEYPSQYPDATLILGRDNDDNLIGMAAQGQDKGRTFYLEVVKSWTVH